MAFRLSASPRLAASALATALAAALALPALAQPAPAANAPAAAPAAATAPADGPHAGKHHRGQRAHQAHQRHHQQDGHRHHGDRAQHHAKRLEALKAKLQLTPAQEGAWTAYTTALKPTERPAQLERLDRKAMAELTTPERIDRMRALRAQHAAEADRRGEAIKTFYAALTPEQQKTFDAQAFKKPMKKRHGPQGGHHPRGHRGGEAVGQPAAPAATPAQ